MIPRVVYLLLLPGILFVPFERCDAELMKYDQRQNGETNVIVHAKNLLLVLATSGRASPGLLQQMLTRSMALNQLDSKSESKLTPEEPKETMVYETEQADEGRVPYHVEIIHMEKGGGSQEGNEHLEKPLDTESVEIIESGLEMASLEKKLDEGTGPEVSIDGKKIGKRMRSLWRNEEGGVVDGLEKENRRPGDSKNLEMENLEQSEDLPVKEEDSKAARPGMSLKKQLSKKQEKLPTSMPDERNELTNVFQELVLLGGGIENCGPGRYRDKFGVCQDDKNFN